MTDINLAYSFNNTGEFDEDFNNQQPQAQQPQQSQQPLPQPPPPQLPVSKPKQQIDINEYHQNKEREQIYKQQFQNRNQVQESFSNNYNYVNKQYEYSFWDRMVMSKREVLKLFILSIVIILGISIEKVGFYYISLYLNSTDLSSFQEFLVRISFPLIVFLLLWIIKSL
jgi:hypothetical protein